MTLYSEMFEVLGEPAEVEVERAREAANRALRPAAPSISSFDDEFLKLTICQKKAEFPKSAKETRDNGDRQRGRVIGRQSRLSTRLPVLLAGTFNGPRG